MNTKSSAKPSAKSSTKKPSTKSSHKSTKASKVKTIKTAPITPSIVPESVTSDTPEAHANLVAPTYDELNEVLNHTALKLHPSQVHGLIGGIICGNPNSSAAWEDLVTGGGSEDSPRTHQVLTALFENTNKELNNFLFEFQLILPPESVELPLRAEALTLWCQGFLTGLKLAQIQIVDRQPSEMTEAINDMIEIAKMNYEEVVAGEEDEEAYSELTEYVRMAAILIYQDMHDLETKKNNNSTSHLH